MQIAGSLCHACGDRIVVKIEGAHCPDCEIAFHKECALEGDKCPKCQLDYEALADDRRAEEEAKATEKDARGRSLVILCILAMIIPSALLLALSILVSATNPEAPFPLSAMLSFPISCLVALALYMGLSWARTWVLSGLAVGAVAFLVNAFQAVKTDTVVFGVGFLLGATYIVVLGILSFSPSVSHYFQKRS